MGPRPAHPLLPTAPRSPVRRKAQASPPPQRLPPPPAPALSDELPWGDLSLNKCLVLASFVALLGSAFQLCRGEPGRRPSQGSSRAPKGWAGISPLEAGGSSIPGSPPLVPFSLAWSLRGVLGPPSAPPCAPPFSH